MSSLSPAGPATVAVALTLLSWAAPAAAQPASQPTVASRAGVGVPTADERQRARRLRDAILAALVSTPPDFNPKACGPRPKPLVAPELAGFQQPVIHVGPPLGLSSAPALPGGNGACEPQDPFAVAGTVMLLVAADEWLKRQPALAGDLKLVAGSNKELRRLQQGYSGVLAAVGIPRDKVGGQ